MFASFRGPRRPAVVLAGWLALAGPALAGNHEMKKDLCEPALVPAPNGTYVRNVMQEQADLAKAERMVIHREEWLLGAPAVKICSLNHLEQIAEWLATDYKPHSNFPVRVEPSGDPALDMQRRTTIVNFLVQRGVGDAEARVLLGSGRAEGMRGEEIERVYQRGQQLGTYGSPLFGTGGGATSVFPSFFGGNFNGGFFGGNSFRGF